jgi:hypothetical protein
MAISANAKTVFNYVKGIGDKNVTAADIADGTGLAIKTVNGVVTAAFQRKGLMERIPATVEVDGEQKTVKFIKLTAEGQNFDPDAPAEDKK